MNKNATASVAEASLLGVGDSRRRLGKLENWEGYVFHTAYWTPFAPNTASYESGLWSKPLA